VTAKGDADGLAYVGLSFADFMKLDEDAKKYVLGRINSYRKLEKIGQIIDVAKLLGDDLTEVVESERNRKLIVEAVSSYRKEDGEASIESYFKKKYL